jgi:hypothetical protein
VSWNWKVWGHCCCTTKSNRLINNCPGKSCLTYFYRLIDIYMLVAGKFTSQRYLKRSRYNN